MYYQSLSNHQSSCIGNHYLIREHFRRLDISFIIKVPSPFRITISVLQEIIEELKKWNVYELIGWLYSKFLLGRVWLSICFEHQLRYTTIVRMNEIYVDFENYIRIHHYFDTSGTNWDRVVKNTSLMCKNFAFPSCDVKLLFIFH